MALDGASQSRWRQHWDNRPAPSAAGRACPLCSLRRSSGRAGFPAPPWP